MRTLDERVVENPSALRRLVADLRLLRRLAQMVVGYLIAGARIRRRYRELEARGEVFWVDEELAP